MAVVTVNDGLSHEEDNKILENNLMQYHFNVNRERVPVMVQFVPLVPDHKRLCLRDSFFFNRQDFVVYRKAIGAESARTTWL